MEPKQRDEISTDELFARFSESHDRSVRNEIVERHMSLAEHVAHDYSHRGVDEQDLRQVAMLALVKAVDRFDPDRGSPFTAFASATINGEIKRHFRDHGWAVRPPRSVQEGHLTVRRATEALVQQLGRSPSVGEVAAFADLDGDTVLSALAASNSYRAERIDVDNDEQPGSVERRISTAEPGYKSTDNSLDVARMIDRVPARERRILELRYWHEKTQSEIAEEIGISQMHVSRLLRRTTAYLRRLERAELA